MGARFSEGASIASTRKITRSVNTTNHEPPAKSHWLNSGNTMSGMPGRIDTSQSSSRPSHGKSAGTHRGGPIGKRGSSGPFPAKAQGTSAPAHSLKGGHPGRIEKLAGHTKTRFEGRRKSSMY